MPHWTLYDWFLCLILCPMGWTMHFRYNFIVPRWGNCQTLDWNCFAFIELECFALLRAHDEWNPQSWLQDWKLPYCFPEPILWSGSLTIGTNDIFFAVDGGKHGNESQFTSPFVGATKIVHFKRSVYLGISETSIAQRRSKLRGASSLPQIQMLQLVHPPPPSSEINRSLGTPLVFWLQCSDPAMSMTLLKP